MIDLQRLICVDPSVRRENQHALRQSNISFVYMFIYVAFAESSGNRDIFLSLFVVELGSLGYIAV